MIRTAKAHQHRMHQHALLEQFSPQALARRIDQLHLAVHQRAFRIVLKIRAIGFQSHASLSDPLAPGCVRRAHVAFHGTGSQQRPACCASPRHNASGHKGMVSSTGALSQGEAWPGWFVFSFPLLRNSDGTIHWDLRICSWRKSRNPAPQGNFIAANRSRVFGRFQYRRAVSMCLPPHAYLS